MTSRKTPTVPERQKTHPVIPDGRRWNHNIHYHPLVVASLQPGCRRVVDVGCGEGTLTRALAQRVDLAIGLDRDKDVIELAVLQAAGDHARYVLGDVVAPPFPASSFDAVVSVATLHHVADSDAALTAMADLLRPGGTLAVIGLARRCLPTDTLWELAAAVATRAIRLRRSYWEHPAPTIWPPPHTYREIKRIALLRLPGATFRRRLLWRYSITWTKPAALDRFVE